jgi:hypothetical protein
MSQVRAWHGLKYSYILAMKGNAAHRVCPTSQPLAVNFKPIFSRDIGVGRNSKSKTQTYAWREIERRNKANDDGSLGIRDRESFY